MPRWRHPKDIIRTAAVVRAVNPVHLYFRKEAPAMATTTLPKPARRWARAPFYFNTASHLLRVGRQRADNLSQLLDGLRTCPEDSIFQHTFRTLAERLFIREGFSNDFAPFYFNTASHLLRIGRQRSDNLAQLLEGLRTCPEDSIFQHTFRTLAEHHFIREGFSNHFAHFAFAACNEVGLAERLASVDVREYTSLEALRGRIVSIVDEYLKKNPRAGERAALEPFYFCASDTVV